MRISKKVALFSPIMHQKGVSFGILVEFHYFYSMNEKLLDFNISRILSLTGVVNEYVLGTDIVLGEAHGDRVKKEQSILDVLHYPIRLGCYVFFFLRKGHIRLEFNLGSLDVGERTLLVTFPGSIIRISDYEESKVAGSEIYFLMVSGEILGKLQPSILRNPCIAFSEDNYALAEDYFHIAKRVMSSSREHKEDILVPLLSSFANLVSGEVMLHDSERGPASRQELLYESFITLVTEYHLKERGVAFYADRLNLTPKYLSRVIKKVSGRSAPDWIDSFVILEAKNLLRYSGMSIKEIAYALNFNSQSLFYKFFLSHTGMAPKDYR